MKTVNVRIAAAVALALAGVQAGFAAEGEELEEVQVTGSRITLAPGMSTPTPVTSVLAEEMESLGPNQIIDSLNALPVFRNNSTANGSLGGQNSGGANVNMHGIGANRTLTLLDGRRLVATNRFGSVDVNILPSMLFRNVETVTGGASASYGTDAVAGVTNFILDTKFEGVELKAQMGETFRNDGGNKEYGIAVGHSFMDNRLHVIGSWSHNQLDMIEGVESTNQKRSYLKHWGYVTNPSATGPALLTAPNVVPTDFGTTIQFNAAANNPLDRLVFDGSGQQFSKMPFYGVGRLNGGCNCQSLPSLDLTQMYHDNSLQAGYKGSTGFGRVGFDLNDNTELYVQGIWASNHQVVRWQNVPLVQAWQSRIYADNAYLPASAAALITASGSSTPGAAVIADGGARWVTATIFMPSLPTDAGGGSKLDTGNKLASYTAGLTTKVGDWKVDAYVQHGRNDQLYDAYNLPRVDRLQVAMDAVRDTQGKIVCRASLPQFDPNGYWKDCIPVNLFGGNETLSAQGAAYIHQGFKHAYATVRQDLFEVTGSGSLGIGLPAGDISAAVGANWRRDKFDQGTPNPADEFPALADGRLLRDIYPGNDTRGIIPQYGCTAQATPVAGGVPGLRFAAGGFCGASNSSSLLFSSQRFIEGRDSVKEAFTEFQVPTLAKLPMVERLDTNLAVRWADYEGAGQIWAWKVGLNWEVNDQLRVRATRSRDVRAPNLRDRFDSTLGGINATDRNSRLPPGTGIPYSVIGFSGGNPDLKPEKADTTTAGIVFQPAFLEGFQASLDWYEVVIKGAIAQLGGQNIVDQCNAGDLAICQYVIRNTNTVQNPLGDIVQINNFFLNLNKEIYRGFDAELGYRKSLTLFGGGPESISVRVFGTHYTTVLQQPPTLLGAGGVQTRGATINNLSTTPDAATAILGYRNGPLSVTIVERYTGGRKINRLFEESTVRAVSGAPFTSTVDDNSVGGSYTTDLTVGWQAPQVEGLRVYSTITNLFDKVPPIFPTQGGRTGFGNGVLGDVLGRRYVVGAEYKF
ncbi:MAG: TonB-dependent receptor [Proteobacteria bacterium]|nr:TonB-dependent receptor [Pseudomonadota bacterium]